MGTTAESVKNGRKKAAAQTLKTGASRGRSRRMALADNTVSQALKAVGEAMFEYDPYKDQISWSTPDFAADLMGARGAAKVGCATSFAAHILPDDAARRAETVARARAAAASYQVEYRIADEGSERWVEERGCWVGAENAERQIGIVRTIDEQKQREQKLCYLASYDELTGHLNRAALREALGDALADCKETGKPAAYLLAGIDDLGAINEDFGFDVADNVITELARRMRAVFGPNDVMGRVAGNKFGMIARDCTRERIRELCGDLLSAVRASVVHTPKGAVSASICIGAVPLPADVQSSELAMSRAEAALDQSRRIGRASWSIFSEKTDTISMRRRNTHLSDVILTALNERRVKVAFQPIVSDVNEKPKKYECLIRVIGDDGEPMPAGELIAGAERLGLVHLLDRRVLEIATHTLSHVPDIAVNVNVSWETVKDPVWAEGYLAHLRANRCLADRITVELTETQVVDAIEASIEFVQEIKEIGCSFAIDDFGAGYTSFRNLKALDVDILKIDGSFVTGVSSSRENQLFVRTLLDLARNFGLKTVAEWVDNDADAMLLKGLGVDYLQGYYVGKPEIDPEWMPADAPRVASMRRNRA